MPVLGGRKQLKPDDCPPNRDPGLLVSSRLPEGIRCGHLNKKRMGKMNYRVVSFAVALATCIAAVAQVARQESTNQLKKVVYSGNAANCPQLLVGDQYYWAQVSIPEIKLDNLPSVSAWVYSADYFPSGGWSGINPARISLRDGICYLWWKDYTNIVFTQFTIVITYEADTRLEVANTGTGKSLKLDWKMDAATNQVVRGYKVFRQEKK